MMQRLVPYDKENARKKAWSYCCSALAICVVLYYLTGYKAESVLLVEQALKSNVTSAAASSWSLRGKGGGGGSVTVKAIESLLVKVKKARKEYVDQLKVDYGEEYYEKLFVMEDGVTSRGYASFVPPPRSDRQNDDDDDENDDDDEIDEINIDGDGEEREESKKKIILKDVSHPRLERKLMIKVLSSAMMDNVDDSRFVWATGGHSAAAGHGNLFHQSYTAVMERAARGVFEAASIDFVGRNYAMGGFPSGPELAPCIEAVFGLDVDAVSWDFGMTDVPKYWRKAWYSHRIALHPNRPMIVDMRLDGGHNEGDTFGRDVWTQSPRHLEDLGVTAFYLQSTALKDIHERLPDMFGLNMKQINATPPFVRNFKCQDKIEKGDPFCWEDRFTILDDKRCDTKHGRVDWHPGWREHAIYGNLMAFFLIDNLVNAVNRLKDEIAETSATELLAQYRQQESDDYAHLRSNLDVRENIDGVTYNEIDDDVKPFAEELFGAEATVCQTALLPSQNRYKGYFGKAIHNESAVSPHLFDMAFKESEAKEMEFEPLEDKDGKRQYRDMILTTPDHGHETDLCPTQVLIDYYDFWFTTERMGWTSLSAPHPGYVREYKEKTGKDLQLKGLVVVCSRLCPWGKCPPGHMGDTTLGSGLTLKVNGKSVKKMIPVKDNCYILQRAKDEKYFDPRSDGTYHLQVKVDKVSDDYMSVFDVSSLIIV